MILRLITKELYDVLGVHVEGFMHAPEKRMSTTSLLSVTFPKTFPELVVVTNPGCVFKVVNI